MLCTATPSASIAATGQQKTSETAAPEPAVTATGGDLSGFLSGASALSLSFNSSSHALSSSASTNPGAATNSSPLVPVLGGFDVDSKFTLSDSFRYSN